MKTVKITLRFFMSITFFSLLSIISSAQELDNSILNYDVVYMKDGRVLKGEILIFQETDGDITFEDLKGRKYSITRKEYLYFKENVRYHLHKNDTIAIRPRKETEIEVTLGFTPYPIVLAEGTFTGSSHKSNNNSLMALCANLGIGKYFSRQHYFGAMIDYAMLPDHYLNDSEIEDKLSNYFSMGLRYKYQFDAYKRNTAWFLAAKTKFHVIKGDFDYQYTAPWGDIDKEGVLLPERNKTISIGLGQGVAFILSKKKSINLELTVSRHFTMSTELLVDPEDVNFDILPLEERRFSEIALSLMYNM